MRINNNDDTHILVTQLIIRNFTMEILLTTFSSSSSTRLETLSLGVWFNEHKLECQVYDEIFFESDKYHQSHVANIYLDNAASRDFRVLEPFKCWVKKFPLKITVAFKFDADRGCSCIIKYRYAEISISFKVDRLQKNKSDKNFKVCKVFSLISF